MIWQAGGKPYTVDGTTVGIDFTDPGTRKFTETWQKLIDGKLVAPVTGWTDAWYKGLGDGTIATLVIGAWMPANLESGVKAAHGKWRVAPMPQWEAAGPGPPGDGGGPPGRPPAAGGKAPAHPLLTSPTPGGGVARSPGRAG